ncbi:MAG: hypothetical protein FWG30_09770 [Eubacteriaceae bacterium]|nr:hypothetical protein [Eubacteriaceae bacterium]
MARPKYDPNELQPTGEFYPGMAEFFGMKLPPEPILNKPISAKDNITLALEGKMPYWLPAVGWVNCELQQFRPRQCPDTIATHGHFDGGPAIDFAAMGNEITSWWFDLVWTWEPTINGATVLPRNPKVKDINKWEDYVSIPDLDRIDWDELVEMNKEYLDSGKMNQLGISCGLWERLIALLDVVEASVALYDEDLKEGTHRFLDKFSDFIIDYIGRIADLLPIHNVVLHEDWAHQRGPFFSMDTAREMIVPYLKKIVDYCHSRDMFFEIHMCGDCELIVPVMIEAGCDMWCGQSNLNDQIALAKKFKDDKFLFGIPMPMVAEGASEEEIREIAKAFVDDVKDLHVGLMGFGPTNPVLAAAIYEFSRKAYEDGPALGAEALA